MREPYIVSALLALKPGAEWTTRGDNYSDIELSLIHISEPTRPSSIAYAVFG